MIRVQISDGLSHPQVLRDKSCSGVLSAEGSGVIPGLPPLDGVQCCAQAGITCPHLPPPFCHLCPAAPTSEPGRSCGGLCSPLHLCFAVIRAKAVSKKEVDSGNDIYGNPIKRIQYEIKQIKVKVAVLGLLCPAEPWEVWEHSRVSCCLSAPLGP